MEGRNEAISTYSDTQKTETPSWKIKPLKINHIELLPTKVTTAVLHTPLKQQVFSVPWLTLLRKEQAAIYRKFKTVYVNALLPWKKSILNSNLKADPEGSQDTMQGRQTEDYTKFVSVPFHIIFYILLRD